MKCPIKLKHGKVPDYKFNHEQLELGTKIEKEHINKTCVAKQITKAHLTEHKDYYKRLKKAGL